MLAASKLVLQKPRTSVGTEVEWSVLSLSSHLYKNHEGKVAFLSRCLARIIANAN